MKAKRTMNPVQAITTIGSASILNVLLGLVKMKFAAITLGPAGIGLIGILQQVMSTFSILFGLDLRNAGTRQVAEAAADGTDLQLATVRSALILGSLLLAALGAISFLVLSSQIESYFIESTSSLDIKWIALGIFFTICASSYQALLNGLRRVNDLALITILTGAISTLIAIASIYFWRDHAVIVFVICSPLASYLISKIFMIRLSEKATRSTISMDLPIEFWKMVRFGSAIMLATLVVSAGHLAIRALVQAEYGENSLGYFTAAWLISQYYIGFLYVAITMDFYPRLTSIISDRVESSNAINNQAEIGLLFAAPIFIFMMSCTPYIISTLYSNEFFPAENVLRLLIIGDVLKVLAYPIEFALFAAAAGKLYFALRSIGVFIFVFASYFFLPIFSISGIGIAYIILYIVHLPLLYFSAMRYTGFTISKRVLIFSAVILLSVGLIFAVSVRNSNGSIIAGLIMCPIFITFAWRRLKSRSFR